MLDPRCILLDEPFAGVNPVLIEEICHHVHTLNAQGIAFIVIEHHLQALKSLTNRLIVMDRGAILAEGDPQAVLDDPRVQQAYMGVLHEFAQAECDIRRLWRGGYHSRYQSGSAT